MVTLNISLITFFKKMWGNSGARLYLKKKLWKPWRKPANLPNFRLPAPMGQRFHIVSRNFLKYRNGSIFFWAVETSPDPHWITPHFWKKVITLLDMYLYWCFCLLCWYLFFFLDFKATTEYLSCYKPNTILQYTQSSEYPI